MFTAIVVRPGETDFDRDERIQGALNLPLNSTGWKQVRDVIARLQDAAPDCVLTSRSEPSRSTARMLAEALDVPLKELDGLCNMDQGLWQGMLLSDVRRKHPRVYKQWQDAPQSICPPDGETCEEAAKRVERALRKPMKKGGTFAIVASEPLASLIVCVLEGSDPRIPGPSQRLNRLGQVDVVGPRTADKILTAETTP